MKMIKTESLGTDLCTQFRNLYDEFYKLLHECLGVRTHNSWTDQQQDQQWKSKFINIKNTAQNKQK